MFARSHNRSKSSQQNPGCVLLDWATSINLPADWLIMALRLLPIDYSVFVWRQELYNKGGGGGGATLMVPTALRDLV